MAVYLLLTHNETNKNFFAFILQLYLASLMKPTDSVYLSPCPSDERWQESRNENLYTHEPVLTFLSRTNDLSNSCTNFIR